MKLSSMFVRAYLQASTAEQDAHRALARLAFAQERGLLIATRYVENESGAKLVLPTRVAAALPPNFD